LFAHSYLIPLSFNTRTQKYIHIGILVQTKKKSNQIGVIFEKNTRDFGSLEIKYAK
jgi:hypothetical protein